MPRTLSFFNGVEINFFMLKQCRKSKKIEMVALSPPPMHTIHYSHYPAPASDAHSRGRLWDHEWSMDPR